MNTTAHQESKSNASLTASEREARKKLKAELKFRRKVKKLQVRIQHAISRKDPVVEKTAKEELENLLATKRNGSSINHDQTEHNQQQPITLPAALSSESNPQKKAALDEVLTIFRQLLASIDANEKEKIHADKIQQTKKAKHLLWNMTKGTQSKSMFSDVTALRGYARQKFHSRAALIIESFGKFFPNSVEVATSSLHSSSNNWNDQQRRQITEQREVMKMCWEKLGSVERICSIGCGPGNDAVGMAAFLRSYFNRKDQVKDVFLLDYAIGEWKDAILDNLLPILSPEYVANITCKACDVTHSLGDNEGIEECIKDADIFLASYLLTETRNQWDQFLVEIVSKAKSGALFYFSEPVPWQLHRLMRMSSVNSTSDVSPGVDCSPLQRLKFVWVDSSMFFPDMQRLDGRSGPAVLLAIKT